MKKLLVIYGRENCPYCVKAKDLAKELVAKGKLTNHVYHEQHTTNWTRDDIAKAFNIDSDRIQTVPQIGLITTDDEGKDKVTYIGGYTQLYTSSL